MPSRRSFKNDSQGEAALAAAAFSPTQVPQIAAGEYWLPGVGVSGTTTISWAGRNGTNTLSVGSGQAPDAVTGPGGNPAWQFVAANSDVFIQSSPAGPLTATDGVYVAFWFRYDVLDTTTRVLAEQSGNAGARRWNIRKTGSLAVLQVEWSDDGTNLLTSTVTLQEAENIGLVSVLDKYLFCEVLIDPAGGSLPTKTRMWLDGAEVTWSSQSGTGGAALFNGGIFRVGNNNFENQSMKGQIGPVYIGKRAGGVLLPSAPDRAGLMRYRTPKDCRLQVVLDGNSVTGGQGASVTYVTSYPGVLRAALVSLGYQARDTHDRGLGGQTSQQMVDGFSTRVLPFYDPLFARSALVFFEVRNSSVAGQTAAQIQAQHQAYAALGRGAGFRVFVCTAPGSDGEPKGVGVAGAVNAWIRANWQSFANGFVDLEDAPQFTPSGSVLNPTYYSDGVHLTDAGYAVVAALVRTAITT
jgi:lysophospholipase L1-like esterase